MKEELIVGDYNNSSLKHLQRLQQRLTRIHIKMVGGLIEQQQVMRFQQKPAQQNSAAFTSRKYGYLFKRIVA